MRRRPVIAAIAIGVLAAAFAQGAVARTLAPVPVIAAVGDIACKNPPANNRSVCQYDDVAAAIGARDYDRLLLLGDNQYEYGLYRDYVENYDAYFGELLPITAPAPGNHEYGDPGAAGYFRYFGQSAHGGYYSFDLGSWHVISLDSTVCRAAGAECGPGSAQHEWLRGDLEASDAVCTLAYWHHPRFDWLKYQKADWAEDFELRRSEPLWNLLYANDADVVLSGHNHNYSRWMPADTQGASDPDRGITQFIVGTGGRNLNGFGNFHTRPDIFVRGQSNAFGFLQLRLKPGGWDFRWISAPGQPSFVDRGTGTCH
jgi:hypothetical protein